MAVSKSPSGCQSSVPIGRPGDELVDGLEPPGSGEPTGVDPSVASTEGVAVVSLVAAQPAMRPATTTIAERPAATRSRCRPTVFTDA